MWVRVDDELPDHPKLGGSDEALGKYVRGLCYCGRYLTDGFIPHGVAHRLVGAQTASEFVAVGLWHDRGDRYEVNDYLKYNPTREKALAMKSARSEAGKKGAASRWNGNSHSTCHDTCNGKTDGKTMARPSPRPRPSSTSKDKPLSLSPSVDNPPDSVLGYWVGKTGRDPLPADLRSLAIIARKFGATTTNLAIGQAVQQGESADNYALITTIAKGESSC